MTISPEEQADLDKLKADQAHERELYFGMARDILRADEAQLASMGQRRLGDVTIDVVRAIALKSYTESTLKKIDKLAKDFLKKWPD